ncbi:MAG TPA: RNA polymerase sigma factor [Candidatus Dormibacteraeota bacterium]|nr:RNA polymerase sigma factor [Candidatus Dormibacteraeota bacterium]
MTADDRESDRNRFEDLLVPLVKPGFRLAFAMLQSREEAEDAVQESALKAWRNFRNFRAGSDMGPWFLTIVANQCRSVRRTHRWSAVLVSDEHVFINVDEERLAQGADLRRALNGLPHAKRLVVVLHFYLDLPFDQIGKIIGTSEQAAKTRMYRALRDLRPKLNVSEAVT